MLDKRLSLCAEMVAGDFICDIGTDHAYLVAELLKAGKCKRAIAADINEKPLASAKATLEKYGVSDKAALILSDGLKNIYSDSAADFALVTDIVAAGMGGELIAEIFSDAARLRGKNLILQPMTHPAYLRKKLCDNGFAIKAERAVCDGAHIYTVINAEYDGVKRPCDELFEQLGALDFNEPDARKYAEKLTDKLSAAATSLFKGGYYAKSAEKTSLAHKISYRTGGKIMYTVNEILAEMERIAPLKNMSEGDNSGLIVGSGSKTVTKALVALDITNEIIAEAKSVGANLIISHHPVMNYNYEPFSTLNPDMPIYRLAENGIAAICFHTPLDVAVGGINDIIYDMLKAPLSLGEPEVLEVTTPDSLGYGKLADINRDITADEAARLLKDIFGCTVVRYCGGKKKLKRLAFCSGGGGNILELAKNKGADAYISGDIKHDRWIYAHNFDMAAFDCGHYHTEVIMVEYLLSHFKATYPDLDISRAKSCTDPVEYAV